MRMLLALLLGLYLAWPARAADSGPVLLLPGLPAPAAEAAPGPRCADFLDEAGLRPEGLEYLFCRPATDPRTGRRTLTARYRVPGPQAAAVEAALRGRTGMAALERQAGIWQLPEGGEGRFVLRRSAGEARPGGTLPGRFLPAGELPEGLSGGGDAGGGAAVPSVAGGSDPAAAKGAADGAGTAAVDGPAAGPDASREEGPDAPLAEGSPAAGPSCTVSMGEVPQAGVWAPQRDDWGKVPWFAVTVRLPLSR